MWDDEDGLFGAGWFSKSNDPKETSTRYINKANNRYINKSTGRSISKKDVSSWKKETITKNTLSDGIMDSLLDDMWSSVETSTGTSNDELKAETVNVENKLTVDGIDVGATLKTLQERFLILEDDFKKHDQYPALKDAYEKYKLIEKLLRENK